LTFCSTYDLRPIQPDELIVCLYVTKLAETCSYRTNKYYSNGIRILHSEAGLTNPLPEMFNLERTLRGIKRVKGDVQPNLKLAVTPDILSQIIPRLDLFSPCAMALLPLCWWHFSVIFARLMSAPFMRVPTRSQISPRFAKAILSLLRTCPWFGLTFGALKRSNLVSGPCVSPSRLFPVQCSSRLWRYIASSRRRGQWPRGLCVFLPRPDWWTANLNPQNFCRSVQSGTFPYWDGFSPVCRALLSLGRRNFRLPVRCLPSANQRTGRLESGSRPLICFISNSTSDPARARVAALMAHSIVLTTWRFPGRPPHWRPPGPPA
jgi:hypothetical protein